MKRRRVLALPLCCCTGLAAGLAPQAARAAQPVQAARSVQPAGAPGAESAAGAAPGIVSLGGTVTEIVYALGAGDRLVGVDTSSLYPEAATRLPQVGYFRSLAVEGVVSLRPGLVLASEGAGPPQALAQLGRLGVTVVTITSKPRIDALFEAIGGVADAIGERERGKALVSRIRSELAQLQVVSGGNDQAATTPAPRALILSSHTGRLQAAGRGTAANAIVELAGLANAFDTQPGYKPVSAETVTALRPEIIVTSTLSISGGDVAAFASLPGIATTPAARSGRIVVVDDLLLLGFGPRLPEALRQIRAGLAGEPAQQPASR